MANDTLTPTTTIRLAQATAILLATTTGGANAALSFFVIPQILSSSSSSSSSGRSAGAAARSWAHMFGVTSRVFPVPMMVLPMLLNGFLAWKAPGGGGGGGGGGKGRLRAVYAAIVVATFSIMPWTLVVLGPVNRMLGARSERFDGAFVEGGGEGEGEGEGEELLETLQDRETTRALVDQWGVKNLYRSAVSLLAGCAGLYAAFST